MSLVTIDHLSIAAPPTLDWDPGSPLENTEFEQAYTLRSGKVISFHSIPPDPSEGERHPRQSKVFIALWDSERCLGVLQGMHDLGYFEYSHHNSSLKIADTAELRDGRLAFLLWGDREADGQITLIHSTYLWSLNHPERPEIMEDTAWQIEGAQLIIWRCGQLGSDHEAVRTDFDPDKILHSFPFVS